MTTLSATLQVYDRFTAPLKSMVSSMNAAKSSSQSMNTAMNKNINLTDQLARAQKMALLTGRAFKEAKVGADLLSKTKGTSASDILKAEKNVEKMRKEFSASKSAVESLKQSMNLPTKGINGATQEVKNLENQAEKTGGIFKSMLGANIIGAGIVKGIGAISNGINGLMGDLSASSATWQTFQGNMEQLGQSKSSIASAKKSMQDYATQTIYSASDMASTYSQLAAVGTKNTGQLVKGFGGLAAASEDPAQAMKTLSQQATQMAAKPKVAWEDFKLMLEQSPAGMAAVAKTMDMSTGDLIKNIQGGKVATEDFFKAIQKTGTNANFTKMATQFKTVGQAMDGLTETAVNALQPAFDKVSKIGIKAVSGLADYLGTINFSSIADKVINFFAGIGKAAAEFWRTFKSTGAVSALSGAFFSIKGAIDAVVSAMKRADGKSMFTIKDVAEAVGNAVLWAANQVDNFATFIQRLDPNIIKAIGTAAGIALTAFLGWKAITGVIGGVSGAIKGLSGAFTGVGSAMGFVAKHPILSMIIGLAAAFVYAYATSEKFRNTVNKVASAIGKAVSAIADFVVKNKELVGALSVPALAGFGLLIAGLSGKFGSLLGPLKKATGLFGVFGKTKGSGLGKIAEDASKTTGAVTSLKSKLAGGLNFAIKAVGVAAVIGSLALLAKSLEGIANAGAQAPANLAAFGAVVAGLAGTFALFGSKLQTSMAGIAVFAGSMSVLALAMAPIANAGANAAMNMATFGLVVGGLVMVFALFGTALTAAIPAMAVFGATILMIGAGIGMAAPGLAMLPPIIMALGMAFSMAAFAVAATITMIIGAVSGLVTTIASAIMGVVDTIGNTLVNVFQQAGDSISQVVDSIGNSINQVVTAISDGVSQIVDSVGGAVKGILNSLAKVFDSIGTAALNAGKGFQLLADGISQLVGLSLVDLGMTLGAVAKGLGAIALSGPGLTVAGAGMTILGAGTMLFATAAMVANASMAPLMAGITSLSTTLPLIGPAAVVAGAAMGVFAATVLMSLASLIGATVMLTAFMAIMTLTGVTMGVVSALAMVASAGFLMFGAAATVASVMVMMLNVSLMMVSMSAMMASMSLTTMIASLIMVSVGLLTMNSASLALMATLIMISAATMVVDAALIVLAASAILATVGMVALGAAAIIAGAGMVIAGAGAVVAGAGLVVLSAGIAAVGASLVVLAAGVMSLYSTVATVFNAIVSAVSNAMNNVISAVRSGLSIVRNAFSGIDLGAAGSAIMDSFLGGLKSAWGKVQNFVGGIAGWIKDHKGPISYDKKLLIPAGKAIMGGFNNSLNDNFATVKSSVVSYAGQLQDAASNVTAPMLEAPTMAAVNLGDVMATGFTRAATALDVLIGKLIGLDGANATINSSMNSTPSSSPLTSSGGTKGTTTNNGDQNVNFNFGSGSIVVQTSGNESGEELLEKIAVAARNYSNKSLAFD